MKLLGKITANHSDKIWALLKISSLFVGFSMWAGFLFDWTPALYIFGIFLLIPAILFIVYLLSALIPDNISSDNNWLSSRKTISKVFIALSFISISIILIFILNSNYKETYDILIRTIPDEQTADNYVLTLDYIDIDDNFVGSNYDLEAVIDNQNMPLYDGSQISLGGAFPSTFIQFQLQAIENDSIPDFGWLDETIDIRTLMQDKQFCWNVFVSENRGRYANNTATVKYCFDIQREVDSMEVWSKLLK